MTIIAGLTSIHAYANSIVTGTFYNLTDLHGTEIIERNFEAKPHLFWDLKFSDLGNVELKGEFGSDGTFIIEKIKARPRPNILQAEEK